MIHEANRVRPSPDGLKVGGHQASSASLVTILTALYFHWLRAGDRVAVKPHASPGASTPCSTCSGVSTATQLPTLRDFGGLQAYPSAHQGPRPASTSRPAPSASAPRRRCSRRSPTATSGRTVGTPRRPDAGSWR